MQERARLGYCEALQVEAAARLGRVEVGTGFPGNLEFLRGTREAELGTVQEAVQHEDLGVVVREGLGKLGGGFQVLDVKDLEFRPFLDQLFHLLRVVAYCVELGTDRTHGVWTNFDTTVK